MKTCYIIGAGEEFQPFSPRTDDLVIAADGGYRYLKKNDIRPALIVGDFDSLGAPPEGIETIRHPVMKNDTDMLLAVKIGFEQGYRHFVLSGGMGGRLEHTIANLQTLIYIAQNGGNGVLEGEKQKITAITNSKYFFPGSPRGGISVFADGTAKGATETGLLYPLQNAVVRSAFPIGVSNEFTSVPASVEVKNGTLLIFWDRQ